jgi:hypothetical protein
MLVVCRLYAVTFVVALSTATRLFAANPSVRPNTSSPLLNVNETVVVGLAVSDAPRLFGATAKIVFDNSRLEYLSAEVGELFLLGAKFPPLISVRESGNTLALTTSRNVGDTEVNRNGTLVLLHFRARSVGVAAMHVDPASVALVTKDGTLVANSESLTTGSLAFSIGAGIVLNPASGGPRTRTLVSASGFAPLEEVQVLLDGTLYGSSVRAGVDGDVVFAPVILPDAPASSHSIALLGATSKRRYETRFQITPVIQSVEPVFVGPGDVVRVVAEGFGANERVGFTIQGAAVTTVLSGDQATVAGRLDAQIALPNDMTQGAAELVAEGRTTRLKASRPNLNVSPRILSVTPPSGTVNTRIQVNASGFLPNQSVEVLYDGFVVGATNASAKGSVSFAFPVTADLVRRSERIAIAVVVRGDGLVAANAPFVFVPTPKITEIVPAGGDTNVVPGEIVRVTGTGFLADAPVFVLFGSATVSTGVRASATGDVDVSVALPPQPSGVQTLTIRTGTAAASDKTLNMSGRITDAHMEGGSSPLVGALGTILVVEGQGFLANELISFDLGNLAGIQTTRSAENGSFRAGIVLRQVYGDLALGVGEAIFRARDKANTAETRVLLSSPSSNVVETATVRVLTPTAREGENLRIVGVGFGARFNVGRIFLDSQNDLRLTPQVLPVLDATAGSRVGVELVADANGAFDVTVVLNNLQSDGRIGLKDVFVEFPKTATNQTSVGATFELKPSVKLTDATGAPVTQALPGETVYVSVTGLSPFESPQAQLGFSGVTFLSAANAHGQIVRFPFIVPSMTGGAQSFQVRGFTPGFVAETPIKIIPKVALTNPLSGTTVTNGTLATVIGVGFPDGVVSFDVLGVPLTPTFGTVQAVNGSFFASFSTYTGALPAQGSIRAKVGDVYAITPETLRFLATTFQMNPTSGPAGTRVAVRGAIGNAVSFGGRSLGVLENSANVAGVFEGEFVVPTVPNGDYTVVVGAIPVGATVPTFTVTLSLNATPDVVSPGGVLTVSGTGFGSGRRVTISLGLARPPATAVADATGSFRQTITVPKTAGGLSRVVVTDNEVVASHPVRIAPAIVSIMPDPKLVVDGRIPVGANVTFVADGFQASEELALKIGDSLVALKTRVVSDASGSVKATVPLPPTPFGTYDATLVSNTTGDSATLRNAIAVLPTVDAPRPNTGSQGTKVQVLGTGFGKAELVRVEIGSATFVETTADDNGAFNANETLTSIHPNGSLDLLATGLSTGAKASRSAAFAFRDTRPPVLDKVEEDSKGKTLIVGNTLTVTATLGKDPEVISEATFALGTFTGTMTQTKKNDDGTSVWTGTLAIVSGMSLPARVVDVTFVDLGGNRAKRQTTTRVTVDADVTFDFKGITGATAKTGGTITVTATGEKGGTATFTIAGVLENAPMKEAPVGTYTGTYVVQPEDAVTNAPLTLAFTDPAGNQKSVRTSETVTIRQTTTVNVPLVLGLNLIALPLEDDGIKTAFDLLKRLGPSASFVLAYDAEQKRFVPFQQGSPPSAPSNAPLIGGTAYLVYMERAATLTLTGTAWTTSEMPLSLGLNLVGLTRKDPLLRRLSDFSDRLGDALETVVTFDPDTGAFISYSAQTDPLSSANRLLRLGEGYLLLVNRPITLSLTGGTPE